ncbi:Lsr2 family DNA-binding protein [Jatrophihabitans lederbergiae]
MREWATANGYEVSTRGRISGAVVEAYEAAH